MKRVTKHLILIMALGLLFPRVAGAVACVSFGAKTDFASGRLPYSVAIGDLNGDGKQDLAVTGYGTFNGSYYVSVFLGDGAGGFGAKADFETGYSPTSVVIADLNLDGKPDLAVSSNQHFSVFLNTTPSPGAPASFGTGSQIQIRHGIDVAIADVNGDGKLDAVGVGNASPDSVSVLLGDGTGGFGMETDFATGHLGYYTSLAVADLNHDAKLDVIVTNNDGSNTISVLLGDGTGQFGAASDFVTGGAASSPSTGDLNGDGHIDVATANNVSYSISVLFGDGTGGFGARNDLVLAQRPVSVRFSDMNEDGKADLVWANNDLLTVSVLLGNGDGTFGPKADFATGTLPQGVAIRDLDGDGKRDIVVTNWSDNTVSVLLNQGPPLPAITVRVPSSVRAAAGAPSKTITGTLTGTGTLRWYRSGTALADGSKFSGTTTTTLTVSNTGTPDAGYYQLWATDSCGTVRSNSCYLDIVPCPTAPTITTGPQDVTAAFGSPATFTVVATACEMLRYSWQHFSGRYWHSIFGASSSTYTIPSVNSTHEGNYRCRIYTNGSPWATTRTATLNLNKPQILSVTMTPLSCSLGRIRWTTNVPTTGYVIFGSSCGTLLNYSYGGVAASTSDSAVVYLPGGSSAQFKLTVTDVHNQRKATDCKTVYFNNSAPEVRVSGYGASYYGDLFGTGDGIVFLIDLYNLGCAGITGPVVLKDLRIGALYPPRKADNSVDLSRTLSATGLAGQQFLRVTDVMFSRTELGFPPGSLVRVTGRVEYGAAPVRTIYISSRIRLP